MQQTAIVGPSAPMQQLQFDPEKIVTPSSNPSSVDFQAGSVQAKARYFSQVMQQNTVPPAPSAGSAPSQLQLPQTPSQGLNFNALVLPPQQANDDIDAETNLQLPDGDSVPAYEIEKNLLNALPCVAHAIVFGSKRSILAALLVLKSSNNSDPNLPLSSEGLLLASQFNSSVTTCRSIKLLMNRPS